MPEGDTIYWMARALQEALWNVRAWSFYVGLSALGGGVCCDPGLRPGLG